MADSWYMSKMAMPINRLKSLSVKHPGIRLRLRVVYLKAIALLLRAQCSFMLNHFAVVAQHQRRILMHPPHPRRLILARVVFRCPGGGLSQLGERSQPVPFG